jgi:hypothetical protein
MTPRHTPRIEPVAPHGALSVCTCGWQAKRTYSNATDAELAYGRHMAHVTESHGPR